MDRSSATLEDQNPSECSDEKLIAGLRQVLSSQRRTTARLVAFMAEVDARGLYRGFAYASMFEYAVDGLHMSEGEAFPRIYAGRITRRYPVVLAMLERGELHLSGIRLIGPLLSSQNHAELLDAVRFKSKRQIEKVVASRSPKEDVKSGIRKLPERKLVEPELASAAMPLDVQPRREPASPSLQAPAAKEGTSQAASVQLGEVGAVEATAISAAAVVACPATPPAAAGAAPTMPAHDAPRAQTHVGPQGSLTSQADAEARGLCREPGCGEGCVTSQADAAGRGLSREPRSAEGGVTMQADAAARGLCREPGCGERGVTSQPDAEARGVSLEPGCGQGGVTSQADVETHALSLEPGSREGGLTMTPLRADRYKVQFTADQRLHDKLKQAQHLLRGQLPSGDLAQVVERALDLLIAERMKQRFGVGRRPAAAKAAQVEPPAEPPSHRKPAEAAAADARLHVGRRSRHIPAEVRRQVVARDGMQCTFVSAAGRRCEQRGDLEFHHEHPFGRGGETTVANIRLLCAPHNGLLAERDYGRQFIRERIDDLPRGVRDASLVWGRSTGASCSHSLARQVNAASLDVLSWSPRRYSTFSARSPVECGPKLPSV